MKKYFWAILISMMFVACASADEVPSRDISEDFWYEEDTLDFDEGQEADEGRDVISEVDGSTDEVEVEEDVSLDVEVETDEGQEVEDFIETDEGQDTSIDTGTDESSEVCVSQGTDDNCNGIDDDCNGLTDDEWDEYETDCSVQECIRTGIKKCVEGEEFDTCVSAELSDDNDCDGQDDDCDGQTDEHYQVREVACDSDACEDTGTVSCIEGIEMDTCTYLFRGTAFEGSDCGEPVQVEGVTITPENDQKYQIRLTTKKFEGQFRTGIRVFYITSSIESAWDSRSENIEEDYEWLGITPNSSKNISDDVLVMTLTWGVTDYDYPLAVILTDPVPDTVLEVLSKNDAGIWELMADSQKILTEAGCTKAFLTLKMLTPVESLHEVTDGACLE